MWTSKRLLLLLCCMGCIGGYFYRFLILDTLDKYRPPPFKVFKQPNISISFTTILPMKSNLSELLELIDWPEPPSTVSHASFSTSPKNCDYHLLNPRDTYRIGESLQVLITARDHFGQPKNYGGDFFQAKLHSGKVKAGVTGQVKDHGNGSYVATFLLPWTGEAEVHIRLIHSSEAVDVLKKKRESHPGKVYFNGYFRYNGRSAVAECNLQIAGKDVCTYIDPVSGDKWHCVRPQNLPCHSLIFHSMGGYRKVTNALEDSLFSGSVTDKTISGTVPPIIIKPDERFSGLKRIDLHVNYQSGPLIAVETNAGLVMRWKAHGLPLRTTKTMMSDLHYEAADLAGIGGGPHTVIVLTLWAHFTTYPVRVYLERLEKLQQAISSLLFRSPETTVIIKSANTGYKSIYGSDWLSLQLDILLRAIFKGMRVIILDVWDMTSCHYLPDDIHPGPPVIKNEVDLMLSHICPH
ncbi:NXPE family member 3-like isoform X4 [Ranitomeya variabilis]|uniref:NXPE family member 3-like isoform X4 n=1 Tax=Ranitomeya variabilis TaxID=490064 RepID=UPI004056B663